MYVLSFVAIFLERFSDGDFTARHLSIEIRRLECLASFAAKEISRLRPGWIFARHNAGPRRGTNLTGGIEVGENHSARCQRI